MQGQVQVYYEYPAYCPASAYDKRKR